MSSHGRNVDVDMWKKPGATVAAELICIADFDPSGLGGYAAALHDRQAVGEQNQ